MNQTRQTIAKNTGVMLVSQLLTWSLALLLTIFLPRYLGPSGVGQLHLANSLWAMAMVFAAFGMDILLTKEIARDPERTEELFWTSFLLRLALYLLSALALLIFVFAAGYDRQTVAVIAVVGIASFLNLITGACAASLMGLERMEFISLAAIITKAITTVTIIVLLLMGQDVVVIAAVGVIGGSLNLLIQFSALRHIQPIPFQFDRRLLRWMLGAGLAYLAANAFRVLYQQVDIVIISLLVSEEGVGWYGAADRLFGTLLFIPTVFVTAVFPALTRLYKSQSDSLPKLMSKSFNLLLLCSIPIGLGLLVIANTLVIILFGPEFAKSGPILAVMGIVLILTYQNILLGRFIIAIDKQHIWAWVMGIATLATILLDLVLVPWCQAQFNNGALGGALAFLVTEAGMLLFGLRYLPDGALGRENAWFALRVILAGVVMAAAAWWVRESFILVPVIIGALVYTVGIVVLRVITREDWMMIKEIVQSFVVRMRRDKAQPVV